MLILSYLRARYVFILPIVFVACSILEKSEETPIQQNPIEPFMKELAGFLRAGELPADPTNVPLSTSYCFPDQSGAYSPTDIIVNRGDSGSFVWAQGGGCILRPMGEVWALSRNQSLMLWKNVDSFDYQERKDLPEGISYFYEVNYKVKNILPVRWTMFWFHSIHWGTPELPYQVIINYQKVRGTNFIRYWKGTILIDFVTPNITSVIMRNEVDADQTNDEDTEKTVRQVIEKLRAGTSLSPDELPFPKSL